MPGPYVHVHGPIHRTDLLLRLARHGASAAGELSDALRVPIGGAIDVFVAETDAQFRELQPGSPPGYADAVAYPALGLVVLRDPRIRVATDEPLEKVMDHELVHVLLGRAFAPQRPPTWLQEGAAQLLAHQDGPETAIRLRRAVMGGHRLSLTALADGFPRDAVRADIAYAASLDFIQHVSAEYDRDALPKLVESALVGRSLEDSVEAITGEPLDVVEAGWRRRYARPVASLTWLADLGTGLFWVGGIGLIVAGIVRRRRFRRRLAEMEAEERLVDDVLEAMRRRQ